MGLKPPFFCKPSLLRCSLMDPPPPPPSLKIPPSSLSPTPLSYAPLPDINEPLDLEGLLEWLWKFSVNRFPLPLTPFREDCNAFMSGTPKTVNCPGKLKRYAQDPVKESYDKKKKNKKQKKRKKQVRKLSELIEFSALATNWLEHNSWTRDWPVKFSSPRGLRIHLLCLPKHLLNFLLANYYNFTPCAWKKTSLA